MANYIASLFPEKFNGNSASYDSVAYSNSPTAVFASFQNPERNTGWAAGDQYVSIESLTGSQSADTLVGNNLDYLQEINIGTAIGFRLLGNTLFGLGGDDTLSGLAGDDSLYGGAGNDLLTGGVGNDSIIGGDGIDTAAFSGARANYTIVDLGDSFRVTDNRTGGDGLDVLSGVERASFAGQLVTLITSGNNVTGTVNSDLITTTSTPSSTTRADTLLGLDGNDTLDGGGGNDTLDGGTGADMLVGGAGADQLIGGAGLDTTSYASAGSGVRLDMLLATWSGAFGEAAGDSFSGIEAINGSNFDDALLLTNLDDRASGGAGHDRIEGRDGIDILKGLAGNDTLDGGASADTLEGGDGNDELVGGSGADKLLGGAGADRLGGGTGQDVLTGGSGNDIFVFSASGTGSDLISDFAAGIGLGDVIEWHGQFTSFAGVLAAASNFTGTVQGSAFTGVRIGVGADELYLADVSKAGLAADDFAFL